MRLSRDDAAPTPAAEPGTDRVEVSTRVLACSAAPPVLLVRLKTGRRA
jgi:hypothetical protein